ncbi:hypothetical protein BDQ17DRAFT_1438858 [Cyathus striatus]|nr:hypothetical protein BDQ17DRAFT_1438858 [Cyathus striatus]
MSAVEISLLRAGLNHSDALGYVNVANYTLLVYDVCITLSTEIEFIWGSPWSSMKVVYLLTRYMVFVDAGLLYAPSTQTCFRVFTIMECTYVLGLAIGDLISTARAWAFWRTTRHITTMLSLFWIITWSVQLVLIGYNAGSLKFGVQNLVEISKLRGCVITAVDPTIASMTFAILLVYDGVMTLLILLAVYLDSLRYTKASGVVNVMIKDGVLYFICILGSSLANMIVILKLSVGLNGLTVPLTRAFHSILVCRAILHAREQAYRDVCDGALRISTITEA